MPSIVKANFLPVPSDIDDPACGVTFEDDDGLGYFEATRKGPHIPPPLELRIEWRPESSCPWWAIFADGTVGRCCKTIADAQAYFIGGAMSKTGGG